ncbi:hypothetical protein V8F33_002620 [Rhypophila sp. PSN 637]
MPNQKNNRRVRSLSPPVLDDPREARYFGLLARRHGCKTVKVPADNGRRRGRRRPAKNTRPTKDQEPVSLAQKGNSIARALFTVAVIAALVLWLLFPGLY